MTHISSLQLTIVQEGAVLIQNVDKFISSERKYFPNDQQSLKHRDPNEALNYATNLILTLNAESMESAICTAIDKTVAANMIRCKQDWAGILHVIKVDGGWIPKISIKDFVAMLANHCSLPSDAMPTESIVKVLSFGRTKFPNWKIIDYSPARVKAINNMTLYFLNAIIETVDSKVTGQ